MTTSYLTRCLCQLPMWALGCSLVLLLAAGPACAATVRWVGLVDNRWNNPSNWDSGTTPNVGDDVVFDNPSAPEIGSITLENGSTTVGSLTLSVGGILIRGGTITLTGGLTSSAGTAGTNALLVGVSGGAISVDSGELRLTGATSTLGRITVFGTLRVQSNAQVNATFLALRSGRAVVESNSGVLSVSGGDAEGSSEIVARNGGRFRCSSSPATFVALNGTLSLRLGESFQPGRIDCAQLNMNGSGGIAQFILDHNDNNLSLQRPDGQAVTLGGSMRLTARAGGRTILRGAQGFTGPTRIVGFNTTLELDGDLTASSATVTAQTTLRGQGRIAGSLVVEDGATVAPGPGTGAGTGTLRAGSLAAADGATFRFNLSTPNVAGGASNDLIEVDGAATVGGSVRIDSIGALGSYPLFVLAAAPSAPLPAIISMPAGTDPLLWVLRAPTARVDLSLRGALRWQPASLTFIATEGTATGAALVALSNSGVGPLDILSIPAPSNAQFARLGGSCPSTPFTLAVGAPGCTVGYRYLPSQPGSTGTTVAVASNAISPADSLTLTGMAVQRLATASPSAVDFGAVVVATAAAPRTVILTNPSSAAVSITGIGLQFGAGFSVLSTNCGASLLSMATCQVRLGFMPATPTMLVDQLQVATGAGLLTVTLQGRGVLQQIFRNGFEP